MLNKVQQHLVHFKDSHKTGTKHDSKDRAQAFRRTVMRLTAQFAAARPLRQVARRDVPSSKQSAVLLRRPSGRSISETCAGRKSHTVSCLKLPVQVNACAGLWTGMASYKPSSRVMQLDHSGGCRKGQLVQQRCSRLRRRLQLIISA